MTDEHAAVGFPNGAVDNDRVFRLPSSKLLMLVTEARYHHDAAVAAGKQVLWRAIPRLGARPAELGWSPGRFSEEALNLTTTPSKPIRDFVFANELDLQDERGDDEDDWSGYDLRYNLIGQWGYNLVPLLRSRLVQARIHWPAFTPDHAALDYVDRWQEAAERCDVVDFHAYDSLTQIATQYNAYRQAFPGKPLALTEWHCKGNLAEESRVLQWLAETMQADALFDAAYFFIWRWWYHPSWWYDAWDIEHDADREQMFLSPPRAVVVEPEPPPVEPLPEPTPEPEPSPPPDPGEPSMPPLPLKPQGVDVASYQGYPDWQAVKDAGFVFGVTKFTEGMDYRNPTAKYNWQSMRAQGLKRGGYHWGRPSQSASAQVEYFWMAVQDAGGWESGDFLVLDIEESGGDEAIWSEQFMEALAERLPDDACVLYTGKWFTDQEGFADNTSLARYQLWLADYGRVTCPPPVAPWSKVTFWQYTSTGVVPGISGNVDLSEFQGTYEELAALGRITTTTPEPGEPPVEEYSVGPGIRAKMAEQGDEPATDEMYHGEQYSEAYGKSGNHYVYLKAVNQTFVTWKTS